ncbi:MAG: hypothetical protein EOO70_03965 [Myxococcaceae bacterium]|nr:MAG: hypothetical protein EOO70_03965 [Myxococcaceae bacterium]
MPKTSTTSELPTTPPDGPGLYRQDSAVWVSWWNSGWPSLPGDSQQQLLAFQGEREEDIFPLLTWELSAAHGVRLLGAKEGQNEDYRVTLVHRFLKKEEREDPLAKDERATKRLLLALEKHGRLLRERLSRLPDRSLTVNPQQAEQSAREMPDLAGPPYTLGQSGLPHEADEALACELEHLGEKGRDLAVSIRRESEEAGHRYRTGKLSEEEVWQPWFPTVDGRPPLRHAALVTALWHDVVRHGLAKVPALTRAIYTPVVELLAERAVQLDASTGQRTITSGSAVLARVVNIDASAVRYLDSGIKLFDSIHAHRLLFHLASEGHRQALDGVLDPRILRYPGGYSAFAEACGIKGRKAADQVRAIIEAMSMLDVPLAPGRWAHLFSRDFTEATGQRQARLTIVLGTPLLPDYVQELRAAVGKHGWPAQRAVDLIPLLPVPPVIGRPNEQGRQATLALRVMSELRDHAPDLAKQRGAPLTPERFKELAQASHLPIVMAPRVLEHWLQDHGAEGPAFLKSVDRDRYTLGDAHLAERQFLEASGQLTLDNRAAGRQSSKKRAQARNRVGGR